MKRNYKNIFLASLLALGTLSSCSDSFLDREPSEGIDASKALNSDYDVRTALYGAYGGLADVGLYGLNIPVLGELLSDNSYVANANSGYFTAIPRYTFVQSSAEVNQIWSQAYDVINRANAIINSEPTVTDQVSVNQYKGGAYAIRALMHFELVRHFGKPYTDNPAAPGVPIVLKFDVNALPARNTVAEVYDQVLADLAKAEELITMANKSTRLDDEAVKALIAKVNLYKGTPESYAIALANAEDLINNGETALLPGDKVLEYWANPAPSTIETLFEVSATAIENNGVDELAYYYNQGGYGQNLASPGLYNIYGTEDARRDLIIEGVRGSENPAYIVNKIKNISGDRDDKKVLRMSEVYLIAAEAAARLNQDPLARTYLNALVSERDPNLVYTSSGTQLINDVILERRKELAFEGERFHDLNRLKLDITDRYRTPATVAYGDYRRVLPIPQTELDANKNIAQNDQWGK